MDAETTDTGELDINSSTAPAYCLPLEALGAGDAGGGFHSCYAEEHNIQAISLHATGRLTKSRYSPASC